MLLTGTPVQNNLHELYSLLSFCSPDIFPLEELDEFLRRKFRRKDGLELPILATAIDSGGHYTQAVYNFCRGKFRRRVFAIKGIAVFGKKISKPSFLIKKSEEAALLEADDDDELDVTDSTCV